MSRLPSLPGAPTRRWQSLTPLGIALIYAVVAGAWIFSGDHLVAAMVDGDAERVTRLQTAKGALFIALSATMLYLLTAAARRAIRREQGIAQAVLAQLPEGVTVRDLEGRVVLINAAGAAMLGRPPEAILGRTPAELVDPAIADDVVANDARALVADGPVFSERTVGKGENRRVFRATRIALHDDAGKPLGLIALTHDATALVRSEQALRAREADLLQHEKLEALGRLAGGVAHDFNNLLTVIGTGAELAAEALTSGSAGLAAARADLDEVRRAAQRAGDLTRRLLAFARHHPARRESVDVDTVAADTVALVRRTLRAGVSIAMEHGEGAHQVQGDSTALSQVVLNLTLNAADAMPSGGVVVVATSLVEARSTDDGTGRWVALRVTDHGVGMEDAVRQRALEPFFTTKPDGAGTGLGLATADAIVREHGGRMRIESAPGAGTTVTVLLPATTGSPASPANPVPAPRLSPAAGLAIMAEAPIALLVEDETAVRTLARRALQHAGFLVLEARHGADALRLVEDGAQPRVMITDVAMPELNGVLLAERLRARDPALPILFISGYTAGESIPSMSLGPGHTAFLQKPFTAEALVRAAVGLVEAAALRR